ncbi:hypothetical protein, partial [Alicyclobacillus ferrooxydans]|uniref:hypothetical protein n=1 Tax=Alicyclobacillus ferrooxydans TaxID=471514 RepID=UPI001B80AA13
FASSFLQIPPHGRHPCSWLAVGNSQPPQRTCTAKLSPMPGAPHKGRTFIVRPVSCGVPAVTGQVVSMA